MESSNLKKGLKKIKWLTNDLIYGSRIVPLPTNYVGRRILIYHGVTANAKTDINARFIDVKLFDKQIKYMKENYHVVSLKDYFDGAYSNDTLTVAITFDDGYRNNLTEVLPVLEKHEVPATFFLTTVQQFNSKMVWPDALDLFRYTSKEDEFTFKGVEYKKTKNEFVSLSEGSLKQNLKEGSWADKKRIVDHIIENNNFLNNPSYDPYHKLLSEEDILKLSTSKFAEIGSHGLYHNCLAEIDVSDAREEMLVSKNYLEQVTQKEVVSFAYPDGSYNQQLVNCAEEVGYKNQLIVDYFDHEGKSDPRIECRLGINPYISFSNQMWSLMDGQY